MMPPIFLSIVAYLVTFWMIRSSASSQIARPPNIKSRIQSLLTDTEIDVVASSGYSWGANYQPIPALAALSGGGFVVGWSNDDYDYDTSTHSFSIFGRRYSNLSILVDDTPIQISSENGADFHQFPSLAPLADGGFVAIWENMRWSNGWVSTYSGQRFNNTGAKNGLEFQIGATGQYLYLITAVAALSDGGFVVFWSAYDGGNGIYGQQYLSTGVKVNDVFQVVDAYSYGGGYFSSSYDFYHLSVTGLEDGGFIVVWANLNADEDEYYILGQRYASTGVEVGSIFQINSHTSGYQICPVVAGLLNGGFVVTWISVGQDDSSVSGVFGRIYSSFGTVLGNEFQVNEYASGKQLTTAVAALSDGGFVATRQKFTEGVGWDIFGQRYTNIGAKNGPEFQISSNARWSEDYPNIQNVPVIAGLADGGFVTVWGECNGNGRWIGGGAGIYSQRFDANGNNVGALTSQPTSYPTVGPLSSAALSASMIIGVSVAGFVVILAIAGIYFKRQQIFQLVSVQGEIRTADSVESREQNNKYIQVASARTVDAEHNNHFPEIGIEASSFSGPALDSCVANQEIVVSDAGEYAAV